MNDLQFTTIQPIDEAKAAATTEKILFVSIKFINACGRFIHNLYTMTESDYYNLAYSFSADAFKVTALNWDDGELFETWAFNPELINQ